MVEDKKTVSASIPPPPRLTGDAQTDNLSLMHWVNDFHRIAIVQGGLVQRAEHLAAQEELADQIDPANATAATAQETANDAALLANTAENKASAVLEVVETFGQITVSGTATTATHTFETPQVDDQYNIVLTPVSSTGTPDINSALIIGQTYLAESFEIEVNGAPGSGDSITFNWHLRRATGI